MPIKLNTIAHFSRSTKLTKKVAVELRNFCFRRKYGVA